MDESALLEALQNGLIAGAALDVLCGEPRINRQHSPVQYTALYDNLLLTSHIGGCTWESMQKCEEYLARVVAKDVRDRWK